MKRNHLLPLAQLALLALSLVAGGDASAAPAAQGSKAKPPASADEPAAFAPALARLPIPAPPAATGCDKLTAKSRTAWEMGYAQSLTGKRFWRPISITGFSPEDAPDRRTFHACNAFRWNESENSRQEKQCCIQGFKAGMRHTRKRIAELVADQDGATDEELDCLSSYRAGAVAGQAFCEKNCPNIGKSATLYRGCFELGFFSKSQGCDPKTKPGPTFSSAAATAERTFKANDEPLQSSLDQAPASGSEDASSGGSPEASEARE